NTRSLPDGESIDDYKPSTINMRVRELLAAFECRAYVGYTATPFANIFIDPSASHENVGDDIFPRSFILTLPAPTNYMGPTEVCRRAADPEVGLEGSAGLPLVRDASDSSEIFPVKYGKEFRPAKLPESLSTAIRAFILSCTARAARGQSTSHNSTLIHVA